MSVFINFLHDERRVIRRLEALCFATAGVVSVRSW